MDFPLNRPHRLSENHRCQAVYLFKLLSERR